MQGKSRESSIGFRLYPAVKKAHPDFLFIAEAYWDLEWELQQQGFDFCYDKRLYDRLEHDNAENVRLASVRRLGVSGASCFASLRITTSLVRLQRFRR